MQMSEKGKALIFFTATFPFGSGETFIENEFPYLLEAFDKIVIVTNNLTGPLTRPVPENVTVIRFAYEASVVSKAKAATSFFNPVMQEEMQFIKKKLKLAANKLIVSIMVASYAKANESVKFIDDIIEKHAANMDVYLYSYWMNDMAVSIATYKQKNPKVKAFTRAHGWDVYFERHNPPYLPFRNFILQHLDACFCISNDGKKYVNTKTRNYFDKLKVSHLGTVNNLPPIAMPANHVFKVVSCSNVIPLKRIHLIIEALSQLGSTGVNWTHFGSGPMMDELQEMAKNMLGDKPNVQYNFAGQVTNAQLIEYYANNYVDLFINVSEAEGIPVSIMEANSFGIPAIATNVGGVGEMINNHNGRLIDVDSSAEDIAQKIIKYEALPAEIKQQFRDNAYATWDNLYNAQKNYTAFVDGVINL